MGKIIVIEGTDGSGKQTQSERLYEKLCKDGYKVKRISFPNYSSPSSEPVKMYLSGELGENAKGIDAYQSSALFAVDRLCTMINLKEFYNNDGIIILDRYVQSNMIHQAGKINDLKERDKFLEWLQEFEFGKLKLPRENIVIFLDMPVEISKKLANSRETLKVGKAQDIHEKDISHLNDAYEAGKYVAKKYHWKTIECFDGENIKTIDEIHDIIMKIVKEVI